MDAQAPGRLGMVVTLIGQSAGQLHDPQAHHFLQLAARLLAERALARASRGCFQFHQRVQDGHVHVRLGWHLDR
jgi:hypothetical protein